MQTAGSTPGRSCPGSAASDEARPAAGWRRRSYLVPYPFVDFPALDADDRLLPGRQDRLADAGRLVALVADEHHVRIVKRRLEVDDAALDHLGAALLLVRLLVTLQHVDALDHDLARLVHGAHDDAPLATILSGHDLYGVVAMNVELKPGHDLANLRG